LHFAALEDKIHLSQLQIHSDELLERTGRIGVRSSQKSRSIFAGRDRGNVTVDIDPLR